jgi:hypothetical protein
MSLCNFTQATYLTINETTVDCGGAATEGSSVTLVGSRANATVSIVNADDVRLTLSGLSLTGANFSVTGSSVLILTTEDSSIDSDGAGIESSEDSTLTFAGNASLTVSGGPVGIGADKESGATINFLSGSYSVSAVNGPAI